MLSAHVGVGEIPGMPGTNPRGANTHRLRDACATGRASAPYSTTIYIKNDLKVTFLNEENSLINLKNLAREMT